MNVWGTQTKVILLSYISHCIKLFALARQSPSICWGTVRTSDRLFYWPWTAYWFSFDLLSLWGHCYVLNWIISSIRGASWLWKSQMCNVADFLGLKDTFRWHIEINYLHNHVTFASLHLSVFLHNGCSEINHKQGQENLWEVCPAHGVFVYWGYLSV